MGRLIWIAVAFCVFVGAMIIGLKLYFTSDRLRALILPPLSEALNRRVDARGFSLGVWGGLHVSVRGVTISDRPGFGEVPFVAVEEAALSVAFWPLLSGEIAIGEAALIRPQISVVLDASGEGNYADLLEIEATAEASPGDSGASQKLTVAGFRIEGGTITYADRQGGTVLQLGGIAYDFQMAMVESGLALTGDLNVAQVRWQEAGAADTLDTGSLQFIHRVRRAGDAWAVDALELRWGPLSLTASGRVRSTVDGTHLDLTVDEPQMDLGARSLRDLIGPGVDLSGTLSVQIEISGRLNVEAKPPVYPEVTGAIGLTDVSVQTPDLRVPIERVNATAVLASNDVLTVEKLTAQAGPSDLAVAVRVDGALAHLLGAKPDARPHGRVSVTGKLLDLDALLVIPESLPTEGDQTSPLLPMVQVADGEATLAFDAMVSDSIRYSDLWVHAVAKDGVMRVDSVRAHAMGGTLTARAELDVRGRSGIVPMRAKAAFKDIQANAMLRDFLGWNVPLFGDMGTSVSVSGTLDSTLTVVERDLFADGKAWAARGRLVNWPLLKTSASFVPQMGFMDFSDLPLRDLHMLFRLENERVTMKDMHFKTGDVGCDLRGSVGLDETLDVTVDVDLPADKLRANAARFGPDKIPGLNLDANTRIPLEIWVGGTASDPKIEAQLKPEIKKVLDARKQELQKKATDKAKGLLKSLFKN